MDENEKWIVVLNWEKFQHYKDRRPAWIKSYVDLLHNDSYLGLTPNRRGLLHGLWITYAITNGEVPHNTLRISSWLNMKVTRRDLQALSDAGFIGFSASKPLANRYPRDRDRDIPPKSPKPKNSHCEICDLQLPIGTTLGDHMRNTHDDTDIPF